MGIPGLLKMLKPYTQPVHVKKYSGKRVGIDAYCWLHKGAYACSFGVCEWDQKTSFMQPCVKYCMHRINMLRFNHIIPVVVFDGGRLPSKASTENERQRRRDLNLEQARLKLSQGDVNGAEELYQRAVEITPLMAHEFIKVLKAEGVEFVVAPYEADAQLAYLSSLGPEKGGVTAVISEDSDLLAYGCNVVIYKMDRYGNGEEVTLDDVMKRKGTKEGAPNSLWFGCFTPELFTGMCVLAGCDFLPSVPGIGIKRAHGLVCKYRDLARVLSSMRFDRKLAVPEGYELGFKQANAIFHHARVYDASSRKLSFLKPLPAHFVKGFNGELDFLGPDLPPSRALAIAQGRLDPISMCAFDEFSCVVHPSCPDVPKTPDVGTPLWDEAMQGDVLLGTDEELFATLAASELEVPCSPSNASASCSTANVQLDNGFLAHLNLVACSSNSSTAWPYPNGQQTSCGSTSDRRTVTQSPGKKRVLPLPPNNNPFKKGRAVDKSVACSTEGHFLFTSEVDGQLKNGSLEQDNAGTGVSYRACKEQTQTCTKSLVPDIRSVAEEAVDSKDMAAQVATVREIADSQVLVQVELVKTLTSMQAECSKVQASRHQEFAKTQASIQPQGSLKTQASTASHPASAKVGNGSSIAPQVTKQQREAKTKATKSSMQSKVVASAMVCSTPSLLKFFQRAPTL